MTWQNTNFENVPGVMELSEETVRVSLAAPCGCGSGPFLVGAGGAEQLDRRPERGQVIGSCQEGPEDFAEHDRVAAFLKYFVDVVQVSVPDIAEYEPLDRTADLGNRELLCRAQADRRGHLFDTSRASAGARPEAGPPAQPGPGHGATDGGMD